MMTYKKARKFQVIIIFSVVIILGGILSVFSEIRNSKRVKGVQDEEAVSQEETSTFNDIPVFKSEPPINGYVGEKYSYDVSVSDSDSEDLKLSLIKGPLWISVDGLEVHGVPYRETSMSGEKVVLEISDGVNSNYQTYYLNIVQRDEIKEE